MYSSTIFTALATVVAKAPTVLAQNTYNATAYLGNMCDGGNQGSLGSEAPNGGESDCLNAINSQSLLVDPNSDCSYNTYTSEDYSGNVETLVLATGLFRQRVELVVKKGKRTRRNTRALLECASKINEKSRPIHKLSVEVRRGSRNFWARLFNLHPRPDPSAEGWNSSVKQPDRS
ncbi:hypothetical protein B0H10DRAFT_1940540 [Mycena sp. CBHHK59/15]|nr:hypothetical protein B0H10DRAFT_1940540 [Mycena sp. CBHHK59/15]